MKKLLALIVFALLVLAAVFAVMQKMNVPLPHVFGGPVACTQEAKQCPNGSYVGRTGPNCEFAACPPFVPTTPNQGSSGIIFIEAQIGQSIIGFDATITPIAVLQDSRCPIDVNCIQAGTVSLSAQITSAASTTQVAFTLGQPIKTQTLSITLDQISPAPKAGIKILPSQYIFGFEVDKL